MFNNKGNNETQKQANLIAQNSEIASCVISQGTFIEGKFRTSEDLRLDGTIIGEVKTEKRLVIGKSGKIEGTVSCNESSIKGRVDGELKVTGLLHLLSTALIKGKIVAQKMIVDEGAEYNGECLIGDKQSSKEAVKN